MDFGVHTSTDFDGPTTPSEGAVTAVNERNGGTGRRDLKWACAACGDSVSIQGTRVVAVVRLKHHGHAHFERTVFCDWECWQDWAAQSDD